MSVLVAQVLETSLQQVEKGTSAAFARAVKLAGKNVS